MWVTEGRCTFYSQLRGYRAAWPDQTPAGRLHRRYLQLRSLFYPREFSFFIVMNSTRLLPSVSKWQGGGEGDAGNKPTMGWLPAPSVSISVASARSEKDLRRAAHPRGVA